MRFYKRKDCVTMRKLYKGLLLLSLMTVILWGCGKNEGKKESPTPSPTPSQSEDTQGNDSEAVGLKNTTVLEVKNYFDDQAQIDQGLQAELEKGYSFDEPFVIVNPYGKSPLTAVAIFSTDTEQGGSIRVKGKSSEDDVVGEFAKATNHIVPIYGLYPGETTQVELTLENGDSTTVEVTTDVIDFKLNDKKVTMHDKKSYDYSDLTLVCNSGGGLYMVDSKGDIRWYMEDTGTLGVKVLENGHLIAPSPYTLRPFYYKSGLVEIDLLGKVYFEYAIPGGMHHDVFEMPDNKLLVVSDRTSFETVEDYLVEIDRATGEVVWELDMTELIDPKEGGSLNRTDEDWFHNNGVWYEEKTDTILLSARHVDAIVAVNKTDKTIKWILGDPEGWSEEYQKYFFTQVGDDFEWQYAQHQVSILSNGDILCFDNGAGRTKTTKPDKESVGDDVYSRAVAYRIDEEAMTIEQVWQYGKELGPKFYSEWISGAIELDNDPNNIWITAGANLYNPEEDSYDYGPFDSFLPGLIQSTNIAQVKNNKVIYELKLDHLTYRTLRLSPYKDLFGFDIAKSGKYLGNQGDQSTEDVEINLATAEEAQNVTVSLDPTKMTLSASYTIPTQEDLKDSYIVLAKEDGTYLTFATNQSTVEGEENVKVTVDGWVSSAAVEGSAYDVYIVLGGNLYNTGYQLDLTK